nr:MAG TPA: hypothetical protein [Crassvirales sp.]
MACIVVDGEVQNTFTIKDLENAIKNIFSSEEKQMIISPEGGIGYISRKQYCEDMFKTVIPDKNIGFICPSQIQEDIDKEIVNGLHNYKPFSKCLSNG